MSSNSIGLLCEGAFADFQSRTIMSVQFLTFSRLHDLPSICLEKCHQFSFPHRNYPKRDSCTVRSVASKSISFNENSHGSKLSVRVDKSCHDKEKWTVKPRPASHAKAFAI